MPKDTSRRNTGRPQAETLNTTGLYSVVRHPLYLGNYLMWLGVALFPGAWWAPVIVSLVFWLYYERIMFAEEEFLRRQFGEHYTAWAAATPAFLPRLGRWRSPGRTLQRADRAAPGALQSARAGRVADRPRGRERPRGHRPARARSGLGHRARRRRCSLCLAIRTMKHRTRLLHVEGR